MGRAIANAMRALEYEAELLDDGPGEVARVEVRHPHQLRGGQRLLVGIVELDDDGRRRGARVSYAVPVYRAAIERAAGRVSCG